jgi:hypothetical protein
MSIERPIYFAHLGLLRSAAWSYQAAGLPEDLQRIDMNRDDAGSARRNKRREQLAAALRENLKRRKTQQRLRNAEAQPADAEKAPLPSPNSKR